MRTRNQPDHIGNELGRPEPRNEHLEQVESLVGSGSGVCSQKGGFTVVDQEKDNLNQRFERIFIFVEIWENEDFKENLGKSWELEKVLELDQKKLVLEKKLTEQVILAEAAGLTPQVIDQESFEESETVDGLETELAILDQQSHHISEDLAQFSLLDELPNPVFDATLIPDSARQP